MTAKVNRQLLDTTTFDSGALGMLAMVAHQFSSPGRHHAVVKRSGKPVANFYFIVDDRGEMQLDIDLARTHRDADLAPSDCECKDELKAGPSIVSPKGYVLFHASSGSGYSVVVMNETDRGPRFDSTTLGKGDLFALSLLEPAKYSLINKENGAKGEINVAITQDGLKQIRNLETRYVTAASKFDPERFEVISTQGMVFRIEVPSRIVIQKEKSNLDEERMKPTIRWRRAAERR